MRAYAAGTSRRSKANDAARKSAKLRSGAEKLADRAASEVDRLATDSSLQGGGAGHLVDDRDAQVPLARDDHLRGAEPRSGTAAHRRPRAPASRPSEARRAASLGRAGPSRAAP